MVSEEMNLFDPWRTTLDTVIKNHTGSVDDLIEKIYEGNFHGTYFSTQKLTKEKISKSLLKSLITNYKDPIDVLDAILKAIRFSFKKERIGVKFPIHWNGLDNLENKYLDAKFIFLVRNPYAMISSKLNHPGTIHRKKKYRILIPLIHLSTLLLFIYEFITYYKVYKVKAKNENVLLVRYEDLTDNVQTELERIINFCELDILNYDFLKIEKTSGQPSSNTGIKIEGSKNMNDISKQKLSSFDRKIIHLFLNGIMKKYSYL